MLFFYSDTALKELTATAYDSELLLQQFLAEHPRLMAGDQIDADSPRRWMLVTREMPVAAEDQASCRWSLDHLFLDQDGIPTLVKVKRSTDTRVRREVVGQLLDYAANAVVYWPVEQIISRFEARCAASGIDPETEFQQFAVGDNELRDYWSKVKTNLQAGKIRLVFVADMIPPELRRIIEFLNTQMDPAEVLGLELKQYTGEGLQTLVPRVVGRTSEAHRRKAAGPSDGRAWDEASFLNAFMERHGADVSGVARQIWTWATGRGRVNYGRGIHNGSFIFGVERNGGLHWLFAVFVSGGIKIYFQHMRNYPPFDTAEKRTELLERLNAIQGIRLPNDAIERRPNIALEVLVPSRRLHELIGVLSWATDEIKGPGADMG